MDQKDVFVVSGLRKNIMIKKKRRKTNDHRSPKTSAEEI